MLNIYKPISVTPYQLIEDIRIKFPEIKQKRIAYAGRLDPMAHGVMIYLIDNETRSRDKFQKLTKKYETKIVFGLSTDTYDAMGLINKISDSINIDKIKKNSDKYLKDIQGLSLQKYPPFSYPKINGVSMYKLAREGKLNDQDIPEKEIFVYSSKISNYKKIYIADIKKQIIEKIEKVSGDFRQSEIIKKWKSLDNIDVVIADAHFEVSSGTYIRSLVHDLGVETETGAIAYDILRTQVGDYQLKDSIRL